MSCGIEDKKSTVPLKGVSTIITGWFKEFAMILLDTVLPVPRTPFKRIPKFPFVFALLLSVVAECWAKARNFPSGLKIGLIVAFLVAAWADSMFESMFDIFKGAAPMVVDVIVGTALGGITGGVIGLILGKMDKGESNG